MSTEIDDFIEHFGKKGMRWGTRRANKVSREKTIDKARERVSSGKTHAEYMKAKSTYKAQKLIVGSKEAKKGLRKAKKKRFSEIATSQKAKNGKEKALAIGIIAGVLATQKLSAATRR